MNCPPPVQPLSRPTGPGRRRAFSIVEMIVVMGLMSVIILGLVMMFGQTQRAYKLGTTQSDVLEGGRAVVDMLSREMAALTPSRLDKVVNFYADIPFLPPLQQELSGSPSVDRTNVIYDLYFLTRENQKWSGIGYAIANRQAGMGTLYRYEMSARGTNSPQSMFVNFYRDYIDRGGPDKITTNLNRAFDKQLNLNISRLLDGVVHFRVRAYETNGFSVTNEFGTTVGTGFETNISLAISTLIPGEVRYFGMFSNLVPASIELELGILEDAALAKAKAIPDLTVRSNYLAQQAARVHLFRLRVPVRNVDPTAYQ